jgi:pSer/pThr/pTyr-binding forkhead associated (FHA) protein
MEPTAPRRAPTPVPTPQHGFALRFISGKYQGGEYPLPSNREIVVGRSSELDMVLVEDMVSRRHAKIIVSDDQIVIQDLGSTNGTFVNGEKIKRAKLNEGDRILIGTSIIKLVAADPAQAGASLQKMEQQARSRATQPRTMSGSIDEVPLPDLMQLFSTSKKSGVLVVRTDDAEGKIFLEKGAIVFGSVNDQEEVPPLKSLIRILTWEHGSFDMEPAVEREFPIKLDLSTEGILMEAFRQIDELRRIAAELPAHHALLNLAKPVVPLLRELKPEDLDVLQHVINYGTVETVLNKSMSSDLDTSEILLKLLKEGFIRVD